MIVIDSSVVIAALQGEPGGEVLGQGSEGFAISTVNLAEVVTVLSNQGKPDSLIEVLVTPFRRWGVSLTESQAMQAGYWRRETRKFGLSLGDRCCLALAKDLGATVYTTDRAWADLDLGVAIKVVR